MRHMDSNTTNLAMPAVGSEVRVRVRNPFASGMIPPQPALREYRGQVLDSWRWLTDREFCLEGDRDWPVRVININTVESIELVSGSMKSISVQSQTWDVQGSRGNKYQVARDHRGWTCTCPGFQFRRQCRHISELSEKNESISA